MKRSPKNWGEVCEESNKSQLARLRARVAAGERLAEAVRLAGWPSAPQAMQDALAAWDALAGGAGEPGADGHGA